MIDFLKGIYYKITRSVSKDDLLDERLSLHLSNLDNEYRSEYENSYAGSWTTEIIRINAYLLAEKDNFKQHSDFYWNKAKESIFK